MKGIVHQFGYLLELYRDAGSPEYKIFPLQYLLSQFVLTVKTVNVCCEVGT
jgi:hypothetical protein